MKTARRQRSARRAPTGRLAELRTRLAEAQETLRAIRSGEVDAVVVAGKQGPQIYTLEGAGNAYRVLIESMNEGALTLTADDVIFYANRCFAKMVKYPLEQVMGTSFGRFLSAEDRHTLRTCLQRADQAGSKLQVLLNAGDGSKMPALISIRPLSKHRSKGATVGMVVTNLTDSRRNEERLRGLSHRLVQAQEAERGRVALELHDHITQLLCALLVRCQVLAEKFSARDGPAQSEVMKLRDMLGQTAEEVERISRNLRPGVLGELGLVAVLHSDGAKFAERTGVSLKLACVRLTARLPAAVELAFYRILQEALQNVEKHAHARHVAVRLTRQGAFAEIVIADDGIGFDPDHHPAGRRAKRGFGLLSMRERADSVAGALTVKSAPGQGTTIRAQIPIANGARQSAGG